MSAVKFAFELESQVKETSSGRVGIVEIRSQEVGHDQNRYSVKFVSDTDVRREWIYENELEKA